MDNLFIKGSKVSPSITFQTDGKLKIQGKILTENAVITFQPLFKWLVELHSDEVEFDIDLEYMNTSASMQLYALLMKLDEDCEFKDIKVNWFYDEDDEEHLETGELFEDRLMRTHFNYISLSDKRGVA